MASITFPDPLKALELQSLDVESLFPALTAVEKAIPVLLACIKPILAQLSSPNPVEANEGGNQAAKEAIGRYMDLLDKIQYVLRQTVYYLHETQASSNTLRPAPANSIPTPFASTLPGSSTVDREIGDGRVELGLYGKRVEARTLKDMVDILGRLEREGLGSILGTSPAEIGGDVPSAEIGGRGGEMEVDDTPGQGREDEDEDEDERIERIEDEDEDEDERIERIEDEGVTA